MKNSRFRTLFFGILVIASIGSYSYINSISVESPKPKCNKSYELELEDKSAELPDVKIFKKIIETGRQLIPVTRL